MKKDQFKNNVIIPKLSQNETLVGYFNSTQLPSFGWYFILGPLSMLMTKSYYVAITDKGIHFHKLSMMGKNTNDHAYFPWDVFTGIAFKGGYVQSILRLEDSSGKKRKINIQTRGLKSLAKLDEKTKSFLLKLER